MATPATLDKQLKSIQQLGQQLQTAITQLTKQQQKSQGGGARQRRRTGRRAAIRSAASAPAAL